MEQALVGYLLTDLFVHPKDRLTLVVRRVSDERARQTVSKKPNSDRLQGQRRKTETECFPVMLRYACSTRTHKHTHTQIPFSPICSRRSVLQAAAAGVQLDPEHGLPLRPDPGQQCLQQLAAPRAHRPRSLLFHRLQEQGGGGRRRRG